MVKKDCSSSPSTIHLLDGGSAATWGMTWSVLPFQVGLRATGPAPPRRSVCAPGRCRRAARAARNTPRAGGGLLGGKGPAGRFLLSLLLLPGAAHEVAHLAPQVQPALPFFVRQRGQFLRVADTAQVRSVQPVLQSFLNLSGGRGIVRQVLSPGGDNGQQPVQRLTA